MQSAAPSTPLNRTYRLELSNRPPRRIARPKRCADRSSALRRPAAWLLLAALSWATGAAAQSVSLGWNASSSSGVTGYNVHYGLASGTYTQVSNAGNNLTATISSLTAGQTYFFAVTAYNGAGLESAPSNEVSYTASATSPPAPITVGASLFNAGAAPSASGVTIDDPNAVELGVKFTAATAGNVTAILFYKGPQNTGTHDAHLWDSSGNLLASATFSGESASGWQQVKLTTPVAVAAGTTYIVSYHTSGYYSEDDYYFSNSYTNGSLTAPASGASGGNGVYAYGGSGSFPANTWNAANYWVDLVFVPGP